MASLAAIRFSASTFNVLYMRTQNKQRITLNLFQCTYVQYKDANEYSENKLLISNMRQILCVDACEIGIMIMYIVHIHCIAVSSDTLAHAELV